MTTEVLFHNAVVNDADVFADAPMQDEDLIRLVAAKDHIARQWQVHASHKGMYMQKNGQWLEWHYKLFPVPPPPDEDDEDGDGGYHADQPDYYPPPELRFSREELSEAPEDQ